jgi:hypothetical protein
MIYAATACHIFLRDPVRWRRRSAILRGLTYGYLSKINSLLFICESIYFLFLKNALHGL